MAMTWSYSLPLSISFFRASVTRPFSPQEPSSLTGTKLVLLARNSFSRMTRSLDRNPATASTSQPCSKSFLATGKAMAQPTPPPMTATRCKPSVSVGFPRGPTKSGMLSPCCLWFSFSVVAPTIWKMMSTVPASRSYPATVRGIRSPLSSTRRMMNWPGWTFLATRGASMLMRVTEGFKGSFLTIRYMSRPPLS